jgi:hypothetical protein
MGNWKGAWFLAKHEMKKCGWYHLFTLGFVGYLLLFTTPAIAQQLSGEGDRYSNWMVDFLYLSLLPVLGFMMNRSAMGYWRTDTHSRKLATWRTMPIPPKQIVMGRLLQVATTLLVTQLVFFTAQYVWLSLSGPVPAIGEFIVYGLFWFCYSIIVAVFYISWEMGHSGKVYFIFCCVIVVVILAIVSLMAILKIGQVAITTLQLSTNGLLFLPALLLVIMLAALRIGIIRMTARLQARNYMN